jgi:antitoxin HicB
MNEYLALFEPDRKRGGFVVTFQDFEWGVTQGDTEEDAAEIAIDALEMVIAGYIEKGKPLPVASKRCGRKYRIVRLPALAAMKAELYRAFLESGLREAELARRLRMPAANIDRLFDLSHRSRLDQLEAAFSAIGKELIIGIRNAA